jgi:chromate transporter
MADSEAIPVQGEAEAGHVPPPVSLGALFGAFFVSGISGFGGVLPFARRELVERRRWITAAEFNDMLALCQFLPGPNMLNVSVVMGARYHGALGSLVAFSGLMSAPVAIVLCLGILFDRFGTLAPVAHAFTGLAAAASGLMLATALKIAAPLRRDVKAMAIAAAGLVAVAFLRIPLLLAMAVLLPVSLLLARSRQ